MPGNYIRKDRLYQQAKAEGYRSRAAYKLEELDHRFKLFRKGMLVCDLGCAPGGWLQVAAARVGANGTVLGIDLEPVEPLPNPPAKVELLQGDIADLEVGRRLLALCSGPVDVVLSDMAPDISGIKLRDGFRSAELVALAWEFAQRVLKPGGSFVAKIFPSQECEELGRTLRPHFAKFSRPVLDSSRKSSTELYFVGQGYRAK